MATAVGDILQVTVKGIHEGQEVNNILNFRATAADVEEIDLAQAVWDCFTTVLVDWFAGGYIGRTVSVKRVYPTVSPEYLFDTSGFSGSAGISLPTFAAGLVSLRTDTGGKSGQGRLYLPAVASPNVEGSELTGDAVAVLANFVLCMFGKFVGGTEPFTWGIISRKIREANAGDVANWFKPVTVAVPRVDLATQRSRKLRRGV